MRLLISQNFLLSARFKRSLNILSTAFEIVVVLLALVVLAAAVAAAAAALIIDFRLPLNFCACELAADVAAAMAFNEAANDADFNCFDRLDEWWCNDVDDVKFLTNVDASSLDGVSPVERREDIVLKK